MSERVLVVMPAGATRERAERFFAGRGGVVTLAREEAVAGQALVIEDERVLWHGEDVVEGSAGALVLDSGFMWPMPRLDPTPEQWQKHRDRFDDWLRDERETASIWYCLLEILNDRLPECVNPQRAFMQAALKPAALATLEAVGVTLPPWLVSNDPEQVAAFGSERGELLALPVSPETGEPRWLSAGALRDLPLTEEPVALQRLSAPEALTVVSVAGEVRAVNGALPASAPPLEGAVTAVLPTVYKTLEMVLVELVFRPVDGAWCLSDFSPAPDLGALDEDALEAVLEAVWRQIRGTV